MRFGVLGPVAAWADDGAAITVGGPGPRALLALLALSAGQVVGPDRLIDGLYGEHPPDNAANALQSQVSRLRRGLGDGRLVELHPAGYRLAVDPDQVDAHRFQRLAGAGQQALAVGDHTGAAGLLAGALALWRGPALADVADAPFAPTAAARLAELRAAAIEDRAEAEVAGGGCRAAVPALQELTAEQPLRERARALLMRALHGSGRTAEALLVFSDARRVLADELGADPSAELAAVHLELLRGSAAEPAAAPPAGILPPLPAQLTSFVGRSAELGRIGALLSAGRLVTLTGPGGAGKTRLAIEAGGRQPGEVCFVDLAPVGAGAEVPLAVLTALGLREAGLLSPAGGPGPPALERITAALAGRRLLLILDNCEHVLDEAAALARRLLGGSPRLRVLATSREPLGITGEALCPVAMLGVPSGEVTAGAAADYPAVRLFTDRAAAVRPDFTVHAGNLAAVLRICAALDGLPLAIELAAARLRSLPVAEVAGRLDDRFRLLSRGDRTAAPRHRTLRAVVGWSWELLAEDERALAARLTVFAGGATAAAVARVCGLAEADAVDLLASLVDKSLLEATGDRYRMLDTVRAYGAERLAGAGEDDAVRRAHASYFLALAQQAGRWLRRPEQLDWLARLAAEQGNLHAALRWAVTADPALALRLTAAQCWFWYLRGQTSEGAPLARDLLARLGPEPAAGLLAELSDEYVLTVLAATGLGTQRLAELAGPLRRAAELMRALDRPARDPALHVLWAVTAGPPPPDVDVTEMQVAQLVDDPWSAALVHVSAGFRRLFGGDLAGAQPPFEAALAAFRAVGDRWGMAMAVGQLGQLGYLRGDPATARALCTEAIELVSQLGAGEDLADALSGRADAGALAGDRPAARADYQLAAECARRAGAPATLARALSGLGDLARRDGALADGRRLQEAALASCPPGSFGVNSVRAQILVALGRTADAEGAPPAAEAAYREALAFSVGQWHLPIAAGAAAGLAGLALRAGELDRAAVLLGAAEMLRGAPLATDPDAGPVVAATLAALGGPRYRTAARRGTAMRPTDLLDYLGLPARAADAWTSVSWP